MTREKKRFWRGRLLQLPIITEKNSVDRLFTTTVSYYRMPYQIIHNMADVAGLAAGQYDEMVNYMNTEVLPELSL